MTKRKEIRLRFFEDLPGQRHIAGKDRYLYAKPEPARNIAIIGCGTIGQEHLSVTHLLGRARVHGLYDEQARSLDVACELNQNLSGEAPVRYSSLQEAIADSDVDAFIIATPNFTHLPVLQQVIKSGKPILLEKPMATSLEDAATIVSMCDSYDAHIQVGLQYRFKAIYAETTHEVKHRQSLGDVKTLHMFEHRPPFLDKVGQWNKFAKNTGGTLTEKCCHYFDLLNHYANSRPASVFARGGQAVNFIDFEYDGEASDIMDNATVVIEYENGVRANFELNMFVPNFHEELVVCGDQGRLTARESFNVFQSQSSESSLRVEQAESGALRNIDVAYPSFIEQSGHHGATYFEHEAFHHALDGRPHVAADALEGFWSIVVGQAAEESARAGVMVSVPEFLERHGLQRFLTE